PRRCGVEPDRLDRRAGDRRPRRGALDRGHLARGAVVNSSRRQFLTWLSVGLTGLITAAIGVPILGYLLGPLLRPVENEWRVAGKVVGRKLVGPMRVKCEKHADCTWRGWEGRSSE